MAVNLFDFMRCCRRREAGELGSEFNDSARITVGGEHTSLCEGMSCRVPREQSDMDMVTRPSHVVGKEGFVETGAPFQAFTYAGSTDYRPNSLEEAHYKFVGHGAAHSLGNSPASQLRVVPHRPNHGCKLFMCAFLVVLTVSLSGSVLFLGRSVLDSDGTSIWAQLPAAFGGALPPDRQAGGDRSDPDCKSASGSWSEAQRTRCCTRKGIGCRTDQEQAAHDCRKDLDSFEEVWSKEKRQWCCSVKKAGCPRSDSAEYACDAGSPSTWTAEQQVWCCIHQSKGCPSGVGSSESSPTSSTCNAVCVVKTKPDATCRQRLKYAVTELFAGRPNACSLGHTAVARHCPVCHACAPEERFCPKTSTVAPLTQSTTPAPKAVVVKVSTSKPTTTLPFDCIAGYANWEQLWSTEKKAWCCKHGGLKLGCQGSPTRLAVRQPISTSRQPTSPSATTFLLPYDCLAGLASWQRDWSHQKKQWCCEHSQRGCEVPQAGTTPKTEHVAVSDSNGPPFDCVAGFASWESRWSIIKKAWCCQHMSRGCPPRMTSVPYNCNAGFSHWKTGWSRSKKEWCCRNTGKGCEMPAGQGLSNFDCVAGYSKWESGWSEAKKRYCCARVDCRSTA
mmetsp:Transcript_85774/g.265540  ORF Transcript_85774/g.265540 Transcript_85774/m.265540 type:complete len:616 (-) Transcript_85774:143-1990(-)